MNKKLQAYLWGRRAEIIAKVWLWLKGYKIIAHDFKTPVGQIDLIVMKKNILCYVEVKARQNYVEAMEALKPMQRRRIERAALWHQMNGNYLGRDCRFDLIVCMKGRFPIHYKEAWREGE